MKEEVVKQSKEFQTASVENLLQGRKRDREINCTTQITVLTSIHFFLVLSISSPLLNLDHKGQKIKKTFIRKSFKCNYSLNYFFCAAVLKDLLLCVNDSIRSMMKFEEHMKNIETKTTLFLCSNKIY